MAGMIKVEAIWAQCLSRNPSPVTFPRKFLKKVFSHLFCIGKIQLSTRVEFLCNANLGEKHHSYPAVKATWLLLQLGITLFQSQTPSCLPLPRYVDDYIHRLLRVA